MSFSKNDIQTAVMSDAAADEFEIMEFTISGELFGINVEKVREIMMAQKVKAMPTSHEAVEGVIKPRNEIFTVIDLGKYLGLPEYDKNIHDIFIITNFKNLNFAFHVESVVGIDRVQREAVKEPDRVIFGGEEGIVAGIADYQDKLITILDLEKIIAEIAPEENISGNSENNETVT